MKKLMALCACLLVTVGSRPSAGQGATAPADAPQVTVSISDTTAPPEWELRAPLSITVAQGVDANRLKMRIAYPAQLLDFVQVQPTETLKGAGFGIKAVAAKPNGDSGSFEAEVTAAGKDAKRLPSGVIAVLVFKVGKDAEEGKEGSMIAEDIHAWGSGAAELEATSDRTAMFIVAPPGLPIYNCFFYMH